MIWDSLEPYLVRAILTGFADQFDRHTISLQASPTGRLLLFRHIACRGRGRCTRNWFVWFPKLFTRGGSRRNQFVDDRSGTHCELFALFNLLPTLRWC